MLYEYQYIVAAAVFGIALLIIYIFRRSYVTKSSRIFVKLMHAVVIAAILDLISCYTISYPEKVPYVVNNLVSLGYLCVYNIVSVIYFYYIDSVTKVKKLRRINRVAPYVLSLVLVVVIGTSPLTHAVAYFTPDETGRMVYCHGPLMPYLFGLSFCLFAVELFMLFKARRRMTAFQYAASVSFILVMSSTVVLSMVSPRMLTGEFGCVLTLFFIYSAFEDPAYYTFHETGCLNRRAFRESLKSILDELGEDQFCIAAFTIEDYSYLQRNLGMNLVDEATVQCAIRLYEGFKKNVFCLSEDKFAIYIPPHSGMAPVLRKIDEIFSTPFIVNEEEVSFRISSCTLPYINSSFTAEDVEELVEYRLSAMDESFNSNTPLRQIIEKKHYRDKVLHAIARAIENDEFRVYYQPILNMSTGRFDSAEALIRLYDNELGFINPEYLITLAEESGYIQRIGEIVLEKVCRFIHDNSMEKLGIKYIEVNLSALELNPNHTGILRKLLERYAILPSQINFEITETSRLENLGSIIRDVKDMSDFGIYFSIDDYGSGFASSDYLLKLPVNIVKIDKSILWQAMDNDNAMKVLKSTVEMMHELDKRIVVEGVETEEMKSVLEKLGCDHLQGYYFSKPIPDLQFKEFLMKHLQVNLDKER